jgi:hypothetical protein
MPAYNEQDVALTLLAGGDIWRGRGKVQFMAKGLPQENGFAIFEMGDGTVLVKGTVGAIEINSDPNYGQQIIRLEIYVSKIEQAPGIRMQDLTGALEDRKGPEPDPRQASAPKAQGDPDA